jgi:hypothetical protein
VYAAKVGKEKKSAKSTDDKSKSRKDMVRGRRKKPARSRTT